MAVQGPLADRSQHPEKADHTTRWATTTAAVDAAEVADNALLRATVA